MPHANSWFARLEGPKRCRDDLLEHLPARLGVRQDIETLDDADQISGGFGAPLGGYLARGAGAGQRTCKRCFQPGHVENNLFRDDRIAVSQFDERVCQQTATQSPSIGNRVNKVAEVLRDQLRLQERHHTAIARENDSRLFADRIDPRERRQLRSKAPL